MSASFNANLSTDKDRARFAMGDIADPFLLQDETYTALITSGGGLTTAVKVNLAQTLATICANKASRIEQGPVRLEWSGREKNYLALAARLLAEDTLDGSTLGVPVVGTLTSPDMTDPDVINRLNGLRLPSTRR